MKKVILCLIPALLLSGCAPAEVNEESTTYELAPSLRKADSTKTEGYSLTFTLKDNCFDKKATVFNKEFLTSDLKGIKYEKLYYKRNRK